MPGTHAPQREKPHEEKPVESNKEQSLLTATRQSPQATTKISAVKIKQINPKKASNHKDDTFYDNLF